MAGLKITVACSPSDRSRPVLSGEVGIEGCEAELATRPAGELLAGAVAEKAWDVTEMSMSSHLVLSARETPHYVAVPAFHSRVFRHASIYVNAAAGIARPQDLVGRQIGVQQYQQTAALWVRGMLWDDYGVGADQVTWRTGGLEKPGGAERVSIKLPERIKVEPIGADQTLAGMLADGGIDALIAPFPPSTFDGSKVVRLFPDYPAAEKDYYRRTGFFPIMHGIGVRRSLTEEHPWLARAVYQAFAEGRRRAFGDLEASAGVLRISLPWVRAEYEETMELMGSEIWPYGFKANLPELTAMARYAHEQGLAARQIDPADLFHPSVLSES